MPMTIPELAKKLHRTPQAIQQRMRHIDSIPNFVDVYTSKPHRTRVISDKGVQILMGHIALKSKGHAEREKTEHDNALIRELRSEILYSRQREQHSSKVIDSLNEQIHTITLTSTQLQKQFQDSQHNLQNTRLNLQKERNQVKLLKFKENMTHNSLVNYKKQHGSKINKPAPHMQRGTSEPIKHPVHHGWLYRMFH